MSILGMLEAQIKTWLAANLEIRSGILWDLVLHKTSGKQPKIKNNRQSYC